MVWVITRLAAVLGDGLGRCFAIRAVPPALPARAVGGAHALLDDALEVLGDAVTLPGDRERREGAQTHGRQELRRDDDLARAIPVRVGGERHADGVADALLEEA